LFNPIKNNKSARMVKTWRKRRFWNSFSQWRLCLPKAHTNCFSKRRWNNVWVKVPVTGFSGRDWQNPVKWMFTFAEIKWKNVFSVLPVHIFLRMIVTI